jgi:hypothetical protein
MTLLKRRAQEREFDFLPTEKNRKNFFVIVRKNMIYKNKYEF